MATIIKTPPEDRLAEGLEQVAVKVSSSKTARDSAIGTSIGLLGACIAGAGYVVLRDPILAVAIAVIMMLASLALTSLAIKIVDREGGE